ncbi:unnamed protein product [Eretmochelys imbricata]
MKKVLNANKTSSRVMRDETPEYEPSDISNKCYIFTLQTMEQYVPYTTANVPKAAGIQGINTTLPGSCTVQMHIHSTAIFEKVDKDAARHRLLTIGRSEDRKTSHTVHKQEFLSYAKLFHSMPVCQSEVPSRQHRIRQRKTQQQLQKENQSATIIQSAWRGCQVRREIDGMNKAAAKIQAVFRGYRTRQELPLGFNTYGKDEGL